MVLQMEDEKRIRDKRISIKVTDNVYSYVEDLAKQRGVSMSSLCANVIGEFKVDREFKQKLFMESVQYQNKEMFKTIDLESLILKAALNMSGFIDVPEDGKDQA